ncbi:MAG: hypothetical protein EBT05_19775 [Betaproteobacteria bacterium]|nr:hypothetical protein [Betaproteobacteria bacterium]
MHAITPPLTQAYADFVADSAAWTMPPEIQEVVVLGFTDAIGVMLAGARENAVCRLTQWALMQGGQPHARVVSCQEALPTAQAALINATAAHALDYDDFAFSNHPSAVLVPTILAVADAGGGRRASGIWRHDGKSLCRRLRSLGRPVSSGERPLLRQGLASNGDPGHRGCCGSRGRRPGIERNTNPPRPGTGGVKCGGYF